MNNKEWWRGAAIYQIYPRSFSDSNHDGVGDLPGIIEKLDYVAELGVDGIWISPFFKSPMADFGYDISDYRDVDPLFGTLKDFDTLLDKAHGLDLKVMIDQVLSHTSDQHAWFLESRQDRNNAKADWYVWADANPDGTPPNNWLSIFGGGAWQWEPRRGQYYLHNFLSSQPDLNFHHPDVRKAVLDNVEFWLKRGVDGLRLDAINFCFHDKALRDNPAKPPLERQGRGFSTDNPYAFQYHCYNNTQPENLEFIEKLRQLMDRYPGTCSLGEISSEDSLATMAEYTQTGRLHMGYSFELLTPDYSAAYIRETVENLEQKISGGWPCWAFSNHDVTRVASRWSMGEATPAQAKMLNTLLGCIRGSLCLYQGEELGLTEAEIPFDKLQDPYGISFWPNFKGRDGCRTPMPWLHAENQAAFTSVEPWLPIAKSHLARAVDLQREDPQSVLRHSQAFLHWRKLQQALIEGEIEFINLPEPLLGFWRRSEQQNVLCIFNLGDSEISDSYVDSLVNRLDSIGPQRASIQTNNLTLPSYGFALFKA
ncbi:alpha-amylase family glycosyl hydrolase [Shewanella sp. 1CM18E]|uniref:alpha-amylase family glycosyl hydrolase n=1 Tax=Shewanella sp. 1CM18E TaxID=2929169 RepID=UPI0020BF921E|nr:alpha-amylase family glycosyl hydrolase [Shewanella sp. 1CM18E]MCK8044311.1 alpha-amylase family glycosyl hydrolase [Shewanella sp. 1CM18E]